ncbi:MAG: amidase [Bdellovibrio sp.]
MHELLKMSALEIAAKVAKKEISPSEVLEVHINRIEKVNPLLNAMVEDDFARARQLAAEQTGRLSRDSSNLPVFFGVPFTVKEMFAYAGMKRTGGSIHHKNDISAQDATVVARMKQAGAIPLGTTNVPELGFWFETFNPVYGRTNNPYDLSRTCGGSSGGEGALIGAGASPLGLGSDIGGSIRMPAFFCGIFGHKPTRYLLPLTGHFPYSWEEFQALPENKYPYTSSGPMTRRAEDLYPMLKVLMGADGLDPKTLSQPVLKEKTREWKGCKVLICPSPVFHRTSRVSEEMAQSVKNCGKLFSELGAEVEEFPSRFFVRGLELWMAALKVTKNKHLYEILMGPQEHLSIGKEMLKIFLGQGDYTFPNLVVSLSEIFDDHKKDYAGEIQDLQKMAADLNQALGEEGILITPPFPTVAPQHRAPLWSPFDFIYTGFFTALGNPATVVPMGLSEDGLPLGVQVVARPMNDALTISCAEFLESTFGGWTPQ